MELIDLKEFRDFGYLQELNRRFLHPLGLALVMAQKEDGTLSILGIQDGRDDPEGIVFSDLSDPEDRVRMERIDDFWHCRSPARRAFLEGCGTGFLGTIQPVG
jgi:hypothetical protein